MRFSLLLYGLSLLLRYCAWRYPAFRARLAEKNFTAQMRTKDGTAGRAYVFKDGKVRSRGGVVSDADVTLTFKTAAIGARLLMPPIDALEQINAQKDFLLALEGPDELTSWFTQTVMMTMDPPEHRMTRAWK